MGQMRLFSGRVAVREAQDQLQAERRALAESSTTWMRLLLRDRGTLGV